MKAAATFRRRQKASLQPEGRRGDRLRRPERVPALARTSAHNFGTDEMTIPRRHRARNRPPGACGHRLWPAFRRSIRRRPAGLIFFAGQPAHTHSCFVCILRLIKTNTSTTMTTTTSGYATETKSVVQPTETRNPDRRERSGSAQRDALNDKKGAPHRRRDSAGSSVPLTRTREATCPDGPVAQEARDKRGSSPSHERERTAEGNSGNSDSPRGSPAPVGT